MPLFKLPRSAWISFFALSVAVTDGAQTPYFVSVPSQGAGAVVSDPTIRPMQEPGSAATIFASRPVDLRGIGRPDLILCYGIVPPAPASKMPMRILRPQTDGSLVDVTRQLLGNGALPGAVAPRVIVEGDFNEDGRTDIFVACQGWDASPFPGEINVLLLSNPDGTYTDASANLPQIPDFTHDATVGDVTGDGHLDIYVGNISGQQSVGPYFLLGNGDGTFSKSTAGIPASIASTTEKFTACALVDIDGDGAKDLVLGTHGDGGYLDSIVLFNNGTGDFTVRPRLVLPDGPLGRGNTVVQGIGVLDINHDGKPDLILPSSQYSTFTGLGIQILINKGGGVLADESVARLGSNAARFTGSPFQAPRFADLNGDGLIDFYFANGPVEQVPRYFIVESDGTFSAVPPSGPDALPLGLGFGVHALYFDDGSAIDLVQVAHTAEGDVLYQSFLNATNDPPVIPGQPAAQAVAIGSNISLNVAALGAAPLSYQWRKDDVDIYGATASALALDNVQASDAGIYTCVVTNNAGATTSDAATLTVNIPPVVSQQPTPRSVVAGATVTFAADATGTGPFAYQWRKDGVNIAGANGASLTLSSVTAAKAGAYSVAITNAGGTTISSAATLTVGTDSRLVNLSTRANAGTGDATLILGFYISGTGSKTLIIRGIGPTLANFISTPVVDDPSIVVYSGSTQIATSNDWDPSLANDFSVVGAFALNPGSKDAALKLDLGPGLYTVHMLNPAAVAEGLIEIYDRSLDAGTKLTNLSCRLKIVQGQTVIVGTYLLGLGSNVIARNVGPGLSPYVLDTERPFLLPDPMLRYYDGTDTLFGSNDDWDSSLAADFSAVGAFPIATGSKDAAAKLNLAPGRYSFHASGNTTGGVILVELYQAP